MMRTSLALIAALAAGCSALRGHPDLPVDEPHIEPPLAEAEPYQRSEGSLWRGDESRRFLAFENRATRTGDLVTVLIKETAEAQTQATTDTERKSSFNSKLDSDIALQTLVTRPILNLLNLLGFTERRADPNQSTSVDIATATTDTKYKGDGSSDRNSTLRTTIACLVTEVTRSGLLRIEGKRYITINQETQLIRLSGYVRPEDVQIDNTVSSSLIANASIDYGGKGVVSDKQRVPWFTRLLEFCLPF